MEEQTPTIRFEYTDEYGYHYTAESDLPDMMGTNTLDQIGEAMNVFLKQIGYHRKNDNLLMIDLTEDELSALEDFLVGLREDSD